jgi:hypothetical protein
LTTIAQAPDAAYPAGVPDCLNERVDTSQGGPRTNEIIYINYVNGSPLQVANANVLTALRAAQNAAGSLNAMNANTLWGHLQASTANGLSRVFRRELQRLYGAVQDSFVMAYFRVRVVLRGTLPEGAHSPSREIGWLAALDDNSAVVANGAGVSPEQRIMEHFRRFVKELETPRGGATLRVAEVSSRWLSEYLPDVTGTDHTLWAFKFHRAMCANGYFRSAVYDETARQMATGPAVLHGAAGPVPTAADFRYPSADLLASYAAAQYGEADAVITWNPPVTSFLYETHGGQTAVHWRTQALANLAVGVTTTARESDGSATATAAKLGGTAADATVTDDWLRYGFADPLL